MIRVGVVEDNEQLRDELCRIIEQSEGLLLTAKFGSGEELLEKVRNDTPDVLLMDIQLPGMNGVEAVRRLKSIAPDVSIVMLTVFDQGDWIFESLRAGASGYVLKRAERAEIVDAIRQVHEGGAPMSSSVARKVVQYFGQRPARDDLSQLTEREHEVLTKLSEGLSYGEIAETLGISINTIRKHIRSIYEKLQVRSATEAVARFLRPL